MNLNSFGRWSCDCSLDAVQLWPALGGTSWVPSQVHGTFLFNFKGKDASELAISDLLLTVFPAVMSRDCVPHDTSRVSLFLVACK